ncbi:MAG: mechanosensitive ion channel family protein [Chloroflexota bacterium]
MFLGSHRAYRSLLTLSVVVSAGLLWLAAGLMAPSPVAYAQAERSTVRVDGRAVFRLGPTTDLDASSRARQVERRLETLLQNPTAIGPAVVETPQGDPTSRVISISGVPVVTVRPEDAQDNVTTVEDLALQWSQRIDQVLASASARRLSPGGRFVAEVQAAVATAFARLYESAITVFPRVIAAALVLALFWLIASTVRWLLVSLFRRVIGDLTVENLIKQIAYYAVWGLGLILAADALGFDPQTVVAGLGLTGLALGFALKDIISNFVSGVLILALRPFRLGDQIVVGEVEGSVERIVLRATHIRTYDGRLVLVPNAELFTSRVTNNTASPVRRGSVEVPLAYDVDLGGVADLLRMAAQGSDGVLASPAVSVRIRELGSDGITAEVRYWTDSRRSDYLATASAVRQAVVAGLKEAGIELPDPALRLLVRQDTRDSNRGDSGASNRAA